MNKRAAMRIEREVRHSKGNCRSTKWFIEAWKAKVWGRGIQCTEVAWLMTPHDVTIICSINLGEDSTG